MTTVAALTKPLELPSDGIVAPAGSKEVTAALKVQKVYRSYRTRRTLADTALTTNEQWWQALEYIRLDKNTITFFKSSERETASSRWSRLVANVSKLGKGVAKDERAKHLAFLHWIEAIDPRHRYGVNLKFYYDVWTTADSGQPFFYWLDLGDGKDIDLEECPRSKLRKHCVKYLGPQERERYEYVIEDGKIVNKLTETPLTTNKDATSIFVMSTSKKLYVGEKTRGVFQHSSFLAGGAIIAAGILEAEDGVLKSISPSSGHYRPDEEVVEYLMSILKEFGINLEEIKIKPRLNPYFEPKSPTPTQVSQSR